MTDRLYLEVNGTDVDEQDRQQDPSTWGAVPVEQDGPEAWGAVPAENPAAPVVAAAIKSNPDQAARARAISQQTQVPADVVERNLPEMEQRVRAEQVSQIAQQSPALEKALADPEVAKIAHDDVENMSTLAQIGHSFTMIPRAIGAAVPRINAGLWGVARAAADVVGWEGATDYAKERQAEQKGFAEAMVPKTGNWALDAAQSGYTSMAQSIIMAPFGLPGMLTSFGLTTGGEGYSDARDKGKGVGESLVFGGLQAGAEVLTEMAPAGHLLKMLSGRQGLLNSLGKFIATEAAGEQLATLWQDFNEWAILNPEKSLRDFAAERPGRAAETLISTIVSVGASSTIAHSVDAVRERGQRAQQAQQATKAVADLVAASESSKLRARDPEAFNRFMADAMTDETGDRPDLYIDGQVFAQSLEAAGLPLERLAEVAPTLAQQVAEAVEVGGDVVLPADQFAATLAGTPLAPALLPHLRTSPDAMSVAEAEVFAQNEPVLFQEATEQAIAQTVAEAADRADQDTVYTEILGRLNRAGRFAEDVNQTYAAVPAAIIKTMASRMGMSAQAFAERWTPTILAENPARPGEVLNDRGFDSPVVNIGLATNDGGAITADEAIAALRSIGVEVVETAQHESDTEQTLVARLSRPLTPEEGEALSVALRQDAVAQAFGVEGALFGPKKDDWGPFNPQFFLTLDGRRASESELLNQATALRSGRETLARFGLKPGIKHKTRQVAAALEARQRRKWGVIEPDDRTGKSAQRIANWMAEEVEFEMRNPEDSGVGWYSAKFQRALDKMAAEFPELATDKTARNTMTLLIAITSDGQKVVPNFAQAMDIYANYRATGQFATSRGHIRQASIDANMARLQELYARYDTVEEVHEYLMQEAEVRELQKIAKERGTTLKTDYQVHVKLPMAALELGPKLGAFYANLMGAHGYLTMDRWWSRTFNRYRGTLLQAPTRAGLDRFKELLGRPDMSDDEAIAATVAPRNAYEAKNFKDGTEIEKAANTIYKAAFENLEDSPFNATDRTFMLDAVGRAAKILARRGYNLSIADIQAILWYYEKRLYGDLGARQTADISYEEAADRVVAARAQGLDLRGSDEGTGDPGVLPGEVPVGEEDFVEDDAGGDGVPEPQFNQDFVDRPGSLTRGGGGAYSQSAPPTRGIHFSNGVRTVLDGRYYGRGMKGDEAARLANATDPRIRDRVYVYIDRGQGILPEQGVGGFAHEVDLPPLYDASQDPLGLKRGVDANTFESRVLDAGYAGYWVEGFTSVQDAAVIMGPASHGLAARAVPPPARPGGVAIAAPQRYSTALTSKEIDIVRDNFDALRDEVPSIKERFGTLTMETQDLPAAMAALSKLGVQLPGESLQQAVWHGSPHSVVRFSFDFIGTGEGAQAFGWGLYFAENRDTAKFYHSILAGLPPVRRIKLGWLTFGEFDNFDYTRRAGRSDMDNILASIAESLLVNTQELYENRDRFRERIKDELDAQREFNKEDPARLRAVDDLERVLMAPGALDLQFAEAEGAVYKLEIPDEAIERMMFWDRPLSEQPESVRKILERVRAETGATYTDRASGESILLLLGKALEGQNDWTAGERDKAAALYLAAAGIPGNRYLDGMSRRKGEGHYNIVVWDQALLDKMNEQVEAQLPQQTSDAPRGTFNPSTNTIALLERADLSTFLHETGHWALEMLVDLAAQPGAPTQVVDDARTLLSWAGVESLQAWQGMTLEQRRAAHEKVAEGFETYLFEGNAPSAELQGAFARFRAWMLNVYKSLTRMRVQLTPEVRSVFDRMLATDEQIAEMSRVREMAPMFESAEAAGMTPEDFAAYLKLGEKAANDATTDLTARTLRDMKWLSNAKGRALKKLQDSAKELRKGIRAEVETEVDAQPVYAAIAFIEKGVASLGLTDAQRAALGAIDSQKTKLDLRVLKELYGEGPEALHRKLKQTLVAAEGGAHPDAVAEAFGFDSGDALVRAILAAEPRQQLVEGLTDQRMLERHGDLTDSESMERAAEMAIHNEARTRFVATEMRTLAEALNPREKVGETTVTRGKFKGQTRSLTVNALMRAAKSYADQIVARTVVRKLSPARHASTAAKEARAAREALAAGKIELALQHKRNQLLHERTSRAMADAQLEFEKMQAYLRKFRNNRARGAIDADYVEQIENVLAAVDTRNATNKRLDSLQSLREWKTAQEEQGLPVVLDPDLVATMNVTNLRDMTMEQLRGLVDQVKSIEHLGKLKKKLLTARDQREFEAIRDEVAATIRANGGKPRDVPFNPSAHDQAWWKSWRGFFAEHRKFASLVRQFDGVVDNGPIWRVLVRGMNDAGNREQALLMDATKKLGAIFAPLEKMKGGLTGDKRLITSLGKSLSRGDRIAVALNWGNELNRARVLNTLTQPQVDEIFSMLTREEWTAVQAIWDHLNEYWPDIAAKEKRVTGTAPEKVESAPFTVVLQDGSTVDLAGGYYPIAYESELSDVAAAHQQAQIAKDMMAGAYTRATTRRGHTQKRAQNVSEPLTWSLTVIDRHINQVVHDLAWHEWLIDAGRILRDREVAGAIRAHYGNETLRTMKQTLQDIAVGDLQTAGAVGRLVAGLRARASAATMGWSVTTALLQPFGILQSIPRVGSKWILKGMRHWAGDTARFENSAAKIREKSPMMRHRTTTFNRDIREVMGRVHRGDSKAKQVFDASLFFAMQKLQLMADVPTWWGAYEKALADGVDEDTAVALADQAVLDAQGSGMTKDLAGVQRGGELQKALSMFYSYFSATWNMMSESTARTDFRNPVQVAGWLADMAALVVVPALGPAVLLAALQGGDDDEDKETGEILADAGLEVLGFLMGTLIGVREFSGFAKGYSYSGPAFTRAIKDVGDAASKSLPKVVDEDEELEETDYRRIVKAFLVALGLPATQVDRSWRGWRAWQEGEAGPAAILVGPPPKD